MMIVSYKNPKLREYCNLLSKARTDTVFSANEVFSIRTIMSDLRSAPNLNDVPLQIESLPNGENGEQNFQIVEGQILIKIVSTSTSKKLSLKNIKRVQILEISRIDLQIVDSHIL